MHDTAEGREARGTIASPADGPFVRRRGARRVLLAAFVLAVASCGGSGGMGPAATPTPDTALPTPTRTPSVPPTPTPVPTDQPGPSEPLDLLRLASGFVLLGGGPEDLRPALSRDGSVVAYPQQDAEEFTYEDPFFPGFFRMGYLYCARAFVWRDTAPPVALDPDPGCPFVETPEGLRGESWPAALAADGALALVNRYDFSTSPYARFGFAGADGTWEDVVWQVEHPLDARPPNYQGNDMTPDGEVVVGTAWLDRPWPGFADSDARPWRYARGSDGPEWLAAGEDAIESALLVSDDGGVIVGCCDDDESGRRALPVVWYGDARPETLPALGGGDEFGERCVASDLSGEGRVVVGRCGVHAVRWVDGVPEEIPIPGEPPQQGDDVVSSAALAVSVDGSLILGRTNAVGLEQGWLWSESDGLRSVRALLEDAGIAVGDGTIGVRELFAPSAFAREGKVLVGRGRTGVGPTFFEFLYRARLR